MSDLNLNFLPWRANERENQRRRQHRQGSLFLLMIVLLMVGWCFILNQQTAKQAQQRARLRAQSHAVNQQWHAIKQQDQQQKQAAQAQAHVQNRVNRKDLMWCALQNIATLSSSDVWISRIEYHQQHMTLNGHVNDSQSLLHWVRDLQAMMTIDHLPLPELHTHQADAQFELRFDVLACIHHA